MKVKCIDCVNHMMPTKLCFMENCQLGNSAYCSLCPCNSCDSDCMEPDIEKDIEERPKFKKRTK